MCNLHIINPYLFCFNSCTLYNHTDFYTSIVLTSNHLLIWMSFIRFKIKSDIDPYSLSLLLSFMLQIHINCRGGLLINIFIDKEYIFISVWYLFSIVLFRFPTANAI